MADKEKDAEDKASEDNAAAPKPKSDMMMYIIVGVGALVVTIGVMMGMISGQQPVEVAEEDSAEESSEHAEEHDAHEEDPETPDIFSELDDLSFLADTQFAELRKPEAHSDEHSGSKHESTKGKHSKNKHAKSDKHGASEPANADDSLVALGWLEAEKKKLTARSKELDEKAKRLEALERNVNQKLTKIGQQEAARLNALAKLYNGMKPDQVARMMVKLDNKTVVAILPRMKSAQAAKILGLLPAARGARISQEMITLSGK